jgi:hypothetical protein
MNDRRLNRCEICGWPTPRNWDGVPAKRCRAHRVRSETDNAAEVNTAGSKSRIGIDRGLSAIFGALAVMIGFMAEVLPESDTADKPADSESTLSLHDMAYYPDKEHDDVGKPLGWVGYGHNP